MDIGHFPTVPLVCREFSGDQRRLLSRLTVDLVGRPRRAAVRVVEMCGVGDPAVLAHVSDRISQEGSKRSSAQCRKKAEGVVDMIALDLHGSIDSSGTS
jgi:hypothetical protein